MKIGIIGTTGKAGSVLSAEAVKRRRYVTAMVVNPDRAARLLGPNVTVPARDAFALTCDDLSGFDVVSTAPAYAYQHLDLAATTVLLSPRDPDAQARGHRRRREPDRRG